MSGTGSSQSKNSERIEFKNVSTEEDPITSISSSYSSRINPINMPELFKGFHIQSPEMHLQWGESWTESHDKQTQPSKVEENPFVFEKPETDFHLQVTKGLLEDLEDMNRNLVTDNRGVPIHDCRGDHPIGYMCQFCDGRRGSWAQPNAKPTKLFQQYQESVLSSPQEFCTDLAAKDPGAEEERYTMDFGLFDRNFYG